jgi:hypothetical protein
VNNSTKIRLRNAIVDALSDGDDLAAHEMLGFIVGQPHKEEKVATVRQLALPAGKVIVDGPARDYHYWVRFVRENFIPFMQANGRSQFTSYELLSWLDNFGGLELTAGDTEQHSNGREVWRSQVCNALSTLKTMGILDAPPFAKDYTIKAIKEAAYETSV